MSRSESFEEPSDSFSSYYHGYVDVEQRTPGTYRKRDLDALKARQRQSAAAVGEGGEEGDGRVNPGFEQEEPVIFARRNPPAYELELIGSHFIVKISLCPFCRELYISAPHQNRWLCRRVIQHLYLCTFQISTSVVKPTKKKHNLHIFSVLCIGVLESKYMYRDILKCPACLSGPLTNLRFRLFQSVRRAYTQLRARIPDYSSERRRTR